MTINELGSELKRMYTNAPKDEEVVHVHLFGIIYGAEIIENGFKPKKIIECSGIKESYRTELSKGIKLSKYVKVK